jgi:N-acetylglucosaminyl-diphospho-decaprenol L-rhamnosyltransferase
MTLSIVIVSFNARVDLENCLVSLAANPPRIAHDIAVVDNASTDGGPAAVQARFPGVRVLLQPRNTGFSAANNVGIRATTGQLVLLLNSDTIVPAGALDALVDRLLAQEDAAVAGPRLVDGEGVAELSFGPMLSPLAELRQKLLMSLHHRRFGPATSWVEQATSREQFVDWVSGACLLMRRADAESVGLLDERYFLYTEDVDFCAAIRAKGRRVLFTPRAEIIHLRGRSRATVADRMNAAYRRSQLAFYEKHHPRWAPLLRAYLAVRGQLPPQP